MYLFEKFTNFFDGKFFGGFWSKAVPSVRSLNDDKEPVSISPRIPDNNEEIDVLIIDESEAFGENLSEKIAEKELKHMISEEEIQYVKNKRERLGHSIDGLHSQWNDVFPNIHTGLAVFLMRSVPPHLKVPHYYTGKEAHTEFQLGAAYEADIEWLPYTFFLINSTLDGSFTVKGFKEFGEGRWSADAFLNVVGNKFKKANWRLTHYGKDSTTSANVKYDNGQYLPSRIRIGHLYRWTHNLDIGLSYDFMRHVDGHTPSAIVHGRYARNGYTLRGELSSDACTLFYHQKMEKYKTEVAAIFDFQKSLSNCRVTFGYKAHLPWSLDLKISMNNQGTLEGSIRKDFSTFQIGVCASATHPFNCKTFGVDFSTSF